MEAKVLVETIELPGSSQLIRYSLQKVQESV